MRRRLVPVLVALNIGLVAGLMTYARFVQVPHAGDFRWALQTARQLLAGQDPYAFVPTPLHIPYPLPVALFGLPLAALPNALAVAIFFGASSALLAFGIVCSGEPWRLCVFLSYPFLDALLWSQWSPLIMAAWYVPVLAPLLVTIKPHTALPVALQRLTWRGCILAALVVLVTLAIYPSWPFRWIAMVGQFQRTVPVAILPMGPLLLLSALGWRDERARLLFAMAVLPFRALYDLCPLWLVPYRAWQAWLLTALSWLNPFMEGVSWQAKVIITLFVPALVFVLQPVLHRSHLAVLVQRARLAQYYRK